ncbi:Acyl-CoA N-acyltransferase [Gracilaria domingensis]|nr:Acyl-CoA N-acyltransferase [Gracilaria domingensis]
MPAENLTSNHDNIEVRRCQQADIPAVAALSRAALGDDDRICQCIHAFLVCSFRRCFVLVVENEIVGFSMFRILRNKDDTTVTVFFEALRVSPHKRRMNIASLGVTKICLNVMNSLSRYLMPKLNWSALQKAEMWPSYKCYKNMQSMSMVQGATWLETMGSTRHITDEEIRDTIQEIHKLGGSKFIHRLYFCDTHTGASTFLQSEYANIEQRSVWKLQRRNKPPALLFRRRWSIDMADPEKDGIYVAYVADIEGAECCAVFADSQNTQEPFFIIFDAAISVSQMNRSSLLSTIERDHHELWFCTDPKYPNENEARPRRPSQSAKRLSAL